MIARPLELASRLRPAPRNFDALFYVNVGLLALFFTLAGSAFVLGPGVGIDFQLPEVAGAAGNTEPFTHHVHVNDAGHIIAGDGPRDMAKLRVWLQLQAQTVKRPSLRILADDGVALSIVLQIAGAAREAGFVSVQSAATDSGAVAPKASSK